MDVLKLKYNNEGTKKVVLNNDEKELIKKFKTILVN